VRFSIVLLPLVLGAGKAMASFWELQDVRAVTKRADAVVLGKVESVNARWEDGRIVSDLHLRVSAAYKGRTPSDIDVRIPGGRVGGISMRASSEPELATGEEHVLFLTEHTSTTIASAHYHVVDGIEGVLTVVRNARGDASVTWIRPETGRPETTSLSTLGDYVHSIAMEQVK
jgi:hypothetical protein